MMSDAKDTVSAFAMLVMIALLFGGFFGWRFANDRRGNDDIARTDTVMTTDTIRDTVTITRFEEVERKVVSKVLVPVVDTVVINDTIRVEIPIEHRHFAARELDVWVSGYKPNVDSARLCITKIIEKTEVVRHVERGNSFSAGISVSVAKFPSQYAVSANAFAVIRAGRLEISPFAGGFANNDGIYAMFGLGVGFRLF